MWRGVALFSGPILPSFYISLNKHTGGFFSSTCVVQAVVRLIGIKLDKQIGALLELGQLYYTEDCLDLTLK